MEDQNNQLEVMHTKTVTPDIIPEVEDSIEATSSGERWTIRCYDVPPNGSRIVNEYNSGIIPESRPDAYFYNIGKTSTYCESFYGTAFGWIGPANGKEVHPGGGSVVSFDGRSYYVTGQKVKNRGNRRALVHCSNTNGWSSLTSGGEIQLKMDINNISRKLVAFGVSKIPYVGNVLSSVIIFFWPENKQSVWDQVKDHVKHMLNAKIMETIQGLLGGELGRMQKRITSLNHELEDPNVSPSPSHYMNIAEDLIGFELKFNFSSENNSDAKNVNYVLLPMYSAVINLKLAFYQFGIINQKKIGLTDDDIYRLKTYITKVVEEAVAYVQKIFQEQFDIEYDTCHVDAIYNSIAIVRQFCAINGFEYFERWQAIAADPYSTKKPYIKALGYSTVYSRASPIMTRQQILDDVEVPLAPKLINGKRNMIKKLDVWIFRMKGGPPKIQGMKIFYENGDTHEMGKHSNEVNTIDFKGKYLKKLTVHGNGALDKFEFEFTDGSKQTSGDSSQSWGKYTVFELEDHIIVGIFVANDVCYLGGQSAGIAVSYLVNPNL